MKNVLYALLGVLAGVALAGLLLFVSRAPAGEPITLQPAPTKQPIVVHVVGAVPRPGVYEFAEGARIQDAIDAAGGLLTSADVNTINLAALLDDSQQLNIPYKAGEEPAQAFSSGGSESDDSLVLPGAEETVTPSQSDVELININTASVEDLDTLPGIGPTIAQRIVDYRTANGPFATIEDLLNVSGIGPATFDEIKSRITV